MNAGYSSAGHRLAAQYSDMAFVAVHSDEPADARRKVDALRALARDDFGRELEVWTPAYVVCRDTEAEARSYVDHYAVACADTAAAEHHAKTVLGNAQIPEESRPAMMKNFAAGTGGFPLVGSPEQIVDRLAGLSAAGVDGVTLSWVDFDGELPQWIEQVMPLMEQADLRTAPVAEPAGR
jgi:alkanesulfonate monooxygenase SsuD/methylene tetrahydromethanopterin reductase-like flavin-dependent oxidoreductase (luciferase family)